jgi:hypothetical protein
LILEHLNIAVWRFTGRDRARHNNLDSTFADQGSSYFKSLHFQIRQIGDGEKEIIVLRLRINKFTRIDAIGYVSVPPERPGMVLRNKNPIIQDLPKHRVVSFSGSMIRQNPGYASSLRRLPTL